MTKRLVCLLLVVVGQNIVANCDGSSSAPDANKKPLVDDDRDWAKPDISAAELLEARGYVAKEFKFTSRDGYHLTVTRGTNPLINEGKRGLDNKLPILFVHATMTNSNSWLLNSAGVRPKVHDTQGVNMAEMTTDKLATMTEGDPSVKSLPFLAMNFGHEVWLLDRRGFGKSRGKLGHENRTIDDALKSMQTSLFGNVLDGFSFSGGMESHRPLRGDEVQAAASTDAGERQKPRDRMLSGSIASVVGAAMKWLNSDSSSALWGSQQSGAPPQGGRVKRGILSRMMSMMADIKSDQSGLSHDEALKDIETRFIETFNPHYWRFSLDESAEIDFPVAIDVVLNNTGQPKVHVVGMSAGGAVVLLGLSAQPDLANKVAKVVLWSPGVNMGSKSDVVYMLGRLVPLLQSYVGPVPFTFTQPLYDEMLNSICGPEFMRPICERFVGLTVGYTGGQSPIKPFYATNSAGPTSSFELTQLTQFARTETPCKLQLNSKKENINRYGQEKAPCYDLGNIKVQNISFYVGNTDTLVSPDAVRTTIRQLKVPAEMNLISKPGVYFNHLAYFMHKNLDKLAVLPPLLDIERGEELSNEVKPLAPAASEVEASKKVSKSSRV